MNEREFSVVEIIAIAGEKNITIAEREGGMVLVWMTSQVGFLDSHDLRSTD
jgi:DNA mismatch repair protein MutH